MGKSEVPSWKLIPRNKGLATVVQGAILHLKAAAEHDGFIHTVMVLKMQNVSEGVMDVCVKVLQGAEATV